jgi:hypothetical protein
MDCGNHSEVPNILQGFSLDAVVRFGVEMILLFIFSTIVYYYRKVHRSERAVRKKKGNRKTPSHARKQTDGVDSEESES